MNESIEDVINKVCGHLPGGYEMQLNMESGSAWVSLVDGAGLYLKLPDQADMTIMEQLNDALCVANGFK